MHCVCTERMRVYHVPYALARVPFLPLTPLALPCGAQAWVFEVDKSRKRDRIKRGLYPGDPSDLPIEAPLEMFAVAGSDFLDPVMLPPSIYPQSR